jgi:hypothetical protein
MSQSHYIDFLLEEKICYIFQGKDHIRYRENAAKKTIRNISAAQAATATRSGASSRTGCVFRRIVRVSTECLECLALTPSARHSETKSVNICMSCMRAEDQIKQGATVPPWCPGVHQRFQGGTVRPKRDDLNLRST